MRTTWSDWGSEITLGTTPGQPPQIIVTGRWQMGQNTGFRMSNANLGKIQVAAAGRVVQFGMKFIY